MKTANLMVAVAMLVGGCASVVEEPTATTTPDPEVQTLIPLNPSARYREDYCKLPDFYAPSCELGGKTNDEIYCPASDGTQWVATPAGARMKFEVIEGSKHGIARILCDVTPSGFVAWRVEE